MNPWIVTDTRYARRAKQWIRSPWVFTIPWSSVISCGHSWSGHCIRMMERRVHSCLPQGYQLCPTDSPRHREASLHWGHDNAIISSIVDRRLRRYMVGFMTCEMDPILLPPLFRQMTSQKVGLSRSWISNYRLGGRAGHRSHLKVLVNRKDAEVVAGYHRGHIKYKFAPKLSDSPYTTPDSSTFESTILNALDTLP